MKKIVGWLSSCAPETEEKQIELLLGDWTCTSRIASHATVAAAAAAVVLIRRLAAHSDVDDEADDDDQLWWASLCWNDHWRRYIVIRVREYFKQ